jgi:nicotinate-nucleotide pyrophosphorylase (carboxylating)
MLSMEEIIQLALAEDIGSGDITTGATVPAGESAHARIVSKQSGVLAGSQIAEMVFEQVDPQLRINFNYRDGDRLDKGMTVVNISGPVAAILKGERVALNFLAHLSGVATMTAQFVAAVAGTSARIVDTRKTTPLIRAFEKEAVRAGGGANHRIGLYDMVLIKENHIRAAGSITKAVQQTRKYMATTGISVKVEVETTNIDEVHEALAVSVDRIMLDNMTVDEMREAVSLINKQAEVEASGGVNLQTVRAIAETGVDLISVGALTHSVPAFDFSLLLGEE